jgi:predicted nucleic acid-binding protein
VAALFDTTVAVLLLRRTAPPDAADLLRAARAEIADGGALLSAVAVCELLIGERTPAGSRRLADALARLPAVIAAVEVAADAGMMGAFLGERGSPVPLPDLLIAATAIWLDVPLLTWDDDFDRSRAVALESTSDHPGADLWRSLRLHPASRAA